MDPPTDRYPATPQPPFSGAAYAGAGGGSAGAGGGYAGAGGGYRVPGGPGYPLIAPPPVQSQSAKKTVVFVAVTAAVLTLLCCAGGIVAVVIGANRTAPNVSEALPTPDVTRSAGQPPTTAPSSTPPPVDDDTRNMSPGDTLVIDGDDGTVEITVTKFRSATKPCTSRGLKPDEGMYVIADVTVAVTKGTAAANPRFFHWVAADGTKTNAIGGSLSGCGKPIPASNDLAAGTKRTGSVVFDVHDTSGALEYQHQLRTAGSWKP
ncbi:DUF4352 domain-containing protein [Micromonospora sp. LH3U1]|uniref:DUF4352 domain-containing protein n=1 Tax=Micromonospora sp. LH3U1 TaxID=3018339 RepID=UPI00234BFE15|nr:DUF4352 domain-containing protein [Micromonospora sp. LH3U1]WCN82216.1 hypothetical protein PCA76_03750 [Micromonospora sp. LH3U1]